MPDFKSISSLNISRRGQLVAVRHGFPPDHQRPWSPRRPPPPCVAGAGPVTPHRAAQHDFPGSLWALGLAGTRGAGLGPMPFFRRGHGGAGARDPPPRLASGPGVVPRQRDSSDAPNSSRVAQRHTFISTLARCAPEAEAGPPDPWTGKNGALLCAWTLPAWASAARQPREWPSRGRAPVAGKTQTSLGVPGPPAPSCPQAQPRGRRPSWRGGHCPRDAPPPNRGQRDPLAYLTSVAAPI